MKSSWVVPCVLLILVSQTHLSYSSPNDIVPLLDLNFQNFDEPTWDSKTNLDPCSNPWRYVTCSGDNVVLLSLSGLDIKGPLSPVIGDIAYLKTLYLDNNLMTGNIPKELGNLNDLETLHLNNNKFNGTIPASLANLSKLQNLNLSYNNLSGEIPTALAKKFTCASFIGNSKLKSQVLNLTHCEFPTNPDTAETNQSKSSSSSKTGIIVGCVVGILGAAVIVLAIIFLFLFKRKQAGNTSKDTTVSTFDTESAISGSYLAKLKRFTYTEISDATKDFDESNLLGEGSFAWVYKGYISSCGDVAIKRLKDRNIRGEKQFLNEVELISRAVHRNVLKLEGFCVDNGERMLIFPLMKKGSVHAHLRGKRNEGIPPLSWKSRRKIAIGAAQGLAYLHDECDCKIVHRDVKADNILLSDDYEAVVGDFGLAKLMDYDATHVTTAVRGTFGHIAPEYIHTGQTSEKTDVFGFGVFLLEISTGRDAFYLMQLPEEEVGLREWMIRMLQNGRLNEIIDSEMTLDDRESQEVEHLIQVALLCMLEDPEMRPTMAEAANMLQGTGLAEKWHTWQDSESVMSQHDWETSGYGTTGSWVAGSYEYSNVPIELSGPR